MENSIENENKGLKFLNDFKRNSDKYLLSFLLIAGGIGILIYSFPKEISLEGGGYLERKQVWTVIMAGICLVITGVISLMYSLGVISKKISLILVGVFFALTVVLGIYNVKSVKDPIAEINYRRTRDNLSIKKLNDIRTVQLAYKKKNEQYAGNFDQLKNFLENDFIIIPKKEELKQITVEVSELSEDSLITLGYFRIDSIEVPMLEHLFTGPAAMKKRKFESFDINSMDIVPLTSNEKDGPYKFEMKASKIFVGNVRKAVFEVRDPKPYIIKADIPYKGPDTLILGSMKEVTTSGNWSTK